MISANNGNVLQSGGHRVRNRIGPRFSRGAPSAGSQQHSLGRPIEPSAYRAAPPGSRDSIERSTRACGAGFAARHYFSRYIQDRITGDRFITIHFDEVYCINRAALCTTPGCLHQVYVSKGGPYRAILNVYAPEIELKLFGGAAVVEIACGQTAEACARDFLWDGSIFAP